ncbi:hypothetical protein ERJ75_000897700 [Trypanosoma vivax]|nr:hypothetical protein ERJ75_000897700 [Trypanosoma vivax]
MTVWRQQVPAARACVKQRLRRRTGRQGRRDESHEQRKLARRGETGYEAKRTERGRQPRRAARSSGGKEVALRRAGGPGQVTGERAQRGATWKGYASLGPRGVGRGEVPLRKARRAGSVLAVNGVRWGLRAVGGEKREKGDGTATRGVGFVRGRHSMHRYGGRNNKAKGLKLEKAQELCLTSKALRVAAAAAETLAEAAAEKADAVAKWLAASTLAVADTHNSTAAAHAADAAAAQAKRGSAKARAARHQARDRIRVAHQRLCAYIRQRLGQRPQRRIPVHRKGNCRHRRRRPSQREPKRRRGLRGDEARGGIQRNATGRQEAG